MVRCALALSLLVSCVGLVFPVRTATGTRTLLEETGPRGALGLLLPVIICLLGAAPAPTLADRLIQLNRATAWTQTAAVPVQFPTFHPQGMVKIGGEFFVSSVEVKQYPARLAGATGALLLARSLAARGSVAGVDQIAPSLTAQASP